MPELELGSVTADEIESVEYGYSSDYKPMSVGVMIEECRRIFRRRITESDVEKAHENARRIEHQELPEKTSLVAFPLPEALGDYVRVMNKTIRPRLRLRGKRQVFFSKMSVARLKSTADHLRAVSRAQGSNILVMPARTDFRHTEFGSTPPVWKKLELGAWETGLLLILDPKRLVRPVDPFINCPGDRVVKNSAQDLSRPGVGTSFSYPYYSIDERGNVVISHRLAGGLSRQFGDAVAFALEEWIGEPS